MSRYLEEAGKRYKAQLEDMNEVEFAKEGLRHLSVSFFVSIILVLIVGISCAYVGKWPGILVAIMMFATLGWFSMLIVWLQLRRIIRKSEPVTVPSKE